MQHPDPRQLTALLRESLQNGRPTRITVTSNSMSPLLQAGDEIIIITTATEQLQPGDIITMATHTGLLTHRFWGLSAAGGQTWLITRGDKPLWFDLPTPTADLLGRVIARQRDGRLLDLEAGGGRWLDSHLARLAAIENRIIASANPSEKVALWKRGIHRMIYTWTKGLTAVTNTLVSKGISGN